jgi:hypothetical protein
MESEASRDSLAELVAVLVADASIGSDATCPISLGKRRSCSISEVKNFGLSIDVPVAQPRVPPTHRRSMIPSVDAFGRCVMKRTLFRADHSGQIIRGYADHQGLGRVACSSSAQDYLESLIEPEVAFGAATGAAFGAAFGYSMIGQRPSSMSICLVGIGLSVVHGGQW